VPPGSDVRAQRLRFLRGFVEPDLCPIASMTRILSFLAFLVCIDAHGAGALPRLGADAGHVTVSGLSSGGFMAVQLHVAHSAIVKGAGVVAGGPYYCAQGRLRTAYYNCADPGLFAPFPALSRLKAEAEAQAKAGRIDPTSGLASARAWLFSGTKDRTVSRDAVEGLFAFYGAYKVNTVIVRDKPAGHAMPTENAGDPECGATRPPFINDCDYDAAGVLLGHLIGGVLPAVAKEGGRLLRFDQQEFAGKPASAISMAEEGYVYVPKACEMDVCAVHVALHGCRQGVGEIGERFVREAGYNRWADSNRLIVLYPQAVARYGWTFGNASFVWNPRGCWDWWGYTGALYHTKEGPQIRALKAMLDRLGAPKKP
jgi:poly(3-hydroxybutyrate) depolymerase